MSKGIAIQTILLLLVGTIVAVIIIYLVYTYTSTTALSAKECEARFISWCTQCSMLGRSSTSPITTAFYNECNTQLASIGITILSTSRCNNIYTECEKVGVKY